MASRQLDEEAIFHTARLIDNAEARDRYLEQICAGDANLRSRVESLLEVHEQEQDFLKSTPNEPAPTVDQSPLTERPGSTIGRYRLMEQVGEGGMGVVFVAEQERPVRRKVALKIIKPGMDTKEVVARFEAERQALALMDHPNIAKVLDAGSTNSGRPYFVMDLVRGIPITDYCDQAKLTIRERLELFIQVCQAIQHAHQKGIIHRDVKPSNVLVTLHDGKPVPKVIDFGVAKATNQRLTERTIYTRLAQIIGTPMYMSPEQAELSGLDVDTRSDIYSLGVLLYELLTGTTPFDKQRFEKAAYDEIRRIVREEEPPKPSTKISTLGKTATSVSQHRGTDPYGLSKSVRGDLDVIVMKAMEKDRTRRYDTASGLAADVQRFLNDEPIVARSPSFAYRFSKLARRNRLAIATSGLILALLVGGIATTSVLLRQANATLRKLADAYFGDAVNAVLVGDRDKGREAIDRARQAEFSPYRIEVLNGLTALNDGEFELAVPISKRALLADSSTQDPDRVGARALFATACIWAGYDDLSGPELSRLEKLEPTSETDLLLKAYALGTYDPRKSWRLLKDAPRIRCSPIGLWIKASNDVCEAIVTEDMELMEQGVREHECVDFLFRESPFALNGHLVAVVSAIENAPKEQDTHRYIKQGQRLADELLQVPDAVCGHWARWMFYRAIGDSQNATAAVRRIGRQPTTYCWFYAADCLLRNEVSAALAEFDKGISESDRRNKYVRIARAHLACNQPDTAQPVRSWVEELLDDPSPLNRRNTILALSIAYPDEIDIFAERAARVVSRESKDGFDPFGEEAMVQFLAGYVEEDELLQQSTSNRFFEANAHYTIGMIRLANGKREIAREHFRKAMTPRAFESFDYAWASAYLARMEADPTWPKWIRDESKP